MILRIYIGGKVGRTCLMMDLDVRIMEKRGEKEL